MMLSLLILTACSSKVQTVYVDKPFEIKVPIKCIVPDVNCSFNKDTDTEVVGSLLECITNLKRANEVCK